jgi:hypothetical protein
MPNGRSSWRQASDNPSSANFELAYVPRAGNAERPERDDIITIVPRCWARIVAGRACEQPGGEEVRLEHMPELVLADLLEEAAEWPPRVVDERIDATLLAEDARDRLLALLRDRDVERNGSHVEPARTLAQLTVRRRIAQAAYTTWPRRAAPSASRRPKPERHPVTRTTMRRD